MRRMPTWPVAVATFVIGFAVADWTGVRPLGGAVLLAGGAWCFARWRRTAGTPRAVALLVFAAALFVASHALADVLGTWGAVVATAAAAGTAAYVLADAPASRARR